MVIKWVVQKTAEKPNTILKKNCFDLNIEVRQGKSSYEMVGG